MESGTGLHVYDVFESQNPVSGEAEVYAVAAEQFVSFEKKIMRITPNGAVTVSDSGIRASLRGLWFQPNGRAYVVGDGMYAKNLIHSTASWTALHEGVTPYYTYGVAGTGYNRILVCGSFGEFLDFSGVSWRSYRQVTAIASGTYYRVALKGNICVAVGYESPQAVVVVGRTPS